MANRWQAFIVVATGLVLLGGGVMGASAHTGQPVRQSSPSSIVTSIHSTALDVLDEIGIGEDASAGPGVIDDGEGLLPEASITLDQAIAAAQAAHPGTLGEVDLEYYDGHLVFNVDMGDQDVKVDADTGAVLGAATD